MTLNPFDDDDGLPPNPQKPHSAEWIYDEIMRHIEPELMLDSIPTLEQRYQEESDEDRTARLGQYQKAFAIYDEAYPQVMGLLDEGARAIRKNAKAVAMQQEQEEKDAEVAAIERIIDSATGHNA